MVNPAFEARLKRYYALWRENNDIYAEWAQARGLSYFELLVLLSLAEGEQTQKRICAQWLLPKQTVHSILRSFQAAGRVELEPLPADRRNKAVRLTPAGRAWALPIAAELTEHEQAVWRALGEETCRALEGALERYAALWREVGA